MTQIQVFCEICRNNRCWEKYRCHCDCHISHEEKLKLAKSLEPNPVDYSTNGKY